MKNLTQNDVVLNHLKEHTLTSAEAFTKYGITRLSARIKNLRDMGYPVVTMYGYGTNRYGHATMYAVYKLLKEEQNGTEITGGEIPSPDMG